MMDLCLAHPEFDRSLELLALLPPHPWMVPMADVIRDAKIGSSDYIRLIAKLWDSYRIRVMRIKVPGVTTQLCIARESWDRAFELCWRYCERTEQ